MAIGGAADFVSRFTLLAIGVGGKWQGWRLGVLLGDLPHTQPLLFAARHPEMRQDRRTNGVGKLAVVENEPTVQILPANFGMVDDGPANYTQDAGAIIFVHQVPRR